MQKLFGPAPNMYVISDPKLVHFPSGVEEGTARDGGKKPS